MTITKFCSEYLAAQGVVILQKPRVASKPLGDREPEFVPRVPEYERGMCDMNARIEVVARAFDPKTGAPRGGSRVEIINMDTNNLFKNCKTLTDVAETYMSFWNRLPTIQSELVLVQSIKWVPK